MWGFLYGTEGNSECVNYMQQGFCYRLLYFGRFGRTIGYTDESNINIAIATNEMIGKQMLVKTKGFTNLAFHAIAVYGMAKAFFGHRNKDSDVGERDILGLLVYSPNNSKWIDSNR